MGGVEVRGQVYVPCEPKILTQKKALRRRPTKKRSRIIKSAFEEYSSIKLLLNSDNDPICKGHQISHQYSQLDLGSRSLAYIRSSLGEDEQLLRQCA